MTQTESVAWPAAGAGDCAGDPAADVSAWLDWIEHLHPADIDLGLDRVATVARRLGVLSPRVPVFTVAGTNGKGSVCAVLEAVMTAAGYRVGCYTSPHLLRFNERIRVAGESADDRDIASAFARVDAARAGESLTGFEFATLAALRLFIDAGVDALVLEVGLGGRLDATNVIDPDVAVVTSIALDHAEWLGHDLDAIAAEKTGIARKGRPLVCGMTQPRSGLRATAATIGARVSVRGVDFDAASAAHDWQWQGPGRTLEALPYPTLGGGYQLDNAATAIAALAASGRLPPADVLACGLQTVRVPGRFECRREGGIEIVLDVAHNPAAAATLARALSEVRGRGRTLAVLGMYADKDAAGVVRALLASVDDWFAVGLAGPRGQTAPSLAEAIVAGGGVCTATAETPLAGYHDALAVAEPGDRVVVVGSFATVADVSARFI